MDSIFIRNRVEKINFIFLLMVTDNDDLVNLVQGFIRIGGSALGES